MKQRPFLFGMGKGIYKDMVNVFALVCFSNDEIE